MKVKKYGNFIDDVLILFLFCKSLILKEQFIMSQWTHNYSYWSYLEVSKCVSLHL